MMLTVRIHAKGPSLVNEGVIDGTLADLPVFRENGPCAQVYDLFGCHFFPVKEPDRREQYTQPLTFSNMAFRDINTLSLSP